MRPVRCRYIPSMASADVLHFAIRLIVSWSLLVGCLGAEDVSIDIVNAARCHVRCLSLIAQGSGVISLEACQQDSRCSDCSRPCAVKLNQSTSACEQTCVDPSPATPFDETGSTCKESCRFLQRVNTIRPGTCPPETLATGLAAVCMKNCVSDADCDSSVGTSAADSAILLKCCSNGCGWTCQRPTHIYEGMPETASAPLVFERPQTDGIELTWQSLQSNTTGLLLYLVASRSHLARHYNENELSPWQVLLQTTVPQAVVNNLKAGHWYQFRVAAVNIYGSHGWSVPSQQFKLSREPMRPERPSNLTEGDTVVIDGKVAVTIFWSTPKNTDLPISRFKIYWSKRLKTVSAQMQSLQEMRRVISGDLRSFQLTDLEPDTTYFVQIQAVVHYDDLRLKSEKASMHIVTYPLSRSADQVVSLPTVAVVTDSIYPPPMSPENVSVQRVYFQNGLLRANVSWNFDEVDDEDEQCDKVLIYWSPEMCAAETGVDEPLAPMMSATTHENHFVVYDLRFACRYLVRLQPVSIHKVTGDMASVSLSTPYCWQASVIGDIDPDCPRNAARLPDEPVNLDSTLLVGLTDITAKITWGAPHVPVADPPITGYQVVWGPVLPQSHHLLMDRAASDSRELPRDVRSIVISVDDDSTYVVYVRAVSRYGRGRVASLRFNTPHLELPTSPYPLYINIGSTTRTNAVRPAVSIPSPTPQYIFIGFTPTRRDSSRPAGGSHSMFNDIAVEPAFPSVRSGSPRLPITATPCLLLCCCLVLLAMFVGARRTV